MAEIGPLGTGHVSKTTRWLIQKKDGQCWMVHVGLMLMNEWWVLAILLDVGWYLMVNVGWFLVLEYWMVNIGRFTLDGLNVQERCFNVNHRIGRMLTCGTAPAKPGMGPDPTIYWLMQDFLHSRILGRYWVISLQTSCIIHHLLRWYFYIHILVWTAKYCNQLASSKCIHANSWTNWSREHAVISGMGGPPLGWYSPSTKQIQMLGTPRRSQRHPGHWDSIKLVLSWGRKSTPYFRNWVGEQTGMIWQVGE